MKILKMNSEVEQRLNDKLNRLREQLSQEVGTKSITDFGELIREINQAETELKELKLINKVATINRREKERRDLIASILMFGVLDRNLFTDSLHLHKGKRKQNKELYSFVDNNNVYFSMGYDGIIEISINGYKFKEGKRYFGTDDDRENKTIHAYKDFNEACEHNNILLKSITVKQVVKQLNALTKATEELKKASDKYDEAKKKNNEYFLRCEKFISEQNANINTLYINN